MAPFVKRCFGAFAYLLLIIGVEGKTHPSTSCWPSSEEPVEQAMDKGAAICFSGRLRSLNQTLELMVKNLFPAFEEDDRPVDVFLYGPLPTASELHGLGRLLEIGVVRTFKFDDESEVHSEFYRTHAKALRKAQRIGGNWLAGSISPGTGFFHMLGHHQCLQMVTDREADLGHRYRHVALSRTDLQWIYPHPPLEFLRRNNFAWVPDSEEDDWGGIYDRHFVLPRNAVAHVLGSWNLLRTGCAYDLALSIMGREALVGNETNTERWTAIRMLSAPGVAPDARLRIGRFPSVAYTNCQYGRMVGRVDARIQEADLKPFLCTEEDDARYPLEHAAVKRFAACIASAGGWSNAAVRRCYCPAGLDVELFERSVGEAFPHRFELCRDSGGALG